MTSGARLLLATDTDLHSKVFSSSWFLVVFGNWSVIAGFPASRTVVAGILGGFIVGPALDQAFVIASVSRAERTTACSRSRTVLR